MPFLVLFNPYRLVILINPCVFERSQAFSRNYFRLCNNTAIINLIKMHVVLLIVLSYIVGLRYQ